MNLLNSEVHIPGFTEVGTSGVDTGRRSANALTNKTFSTGAGCLVHFSIVNCEDVELTLGQLILCPHIFRGTVLRASQCLQIRHGGEAADWNDHMC